VSLSGGFWRHQLLLAPLLFVAFASSFPSVLRATGSADRQGCRTSRFAISLGPEISPPTGQHPLAFRLDNRGAACLLHGYPAVSLFDGRGHVLPFAMRNGGDQVVTSRLPGNVRVERGGSVWIVLDKYRCDLQEVASAHSIRVRLPGTERADRVGRAIPRWLGIGYCGKGDPGSIVYVSPVEPTFRAALAH